ncbi:peptidase S28 [Rhodofomes roseus]|uniref:Peptidase S28 n=1 Tax=Rhodofomes roseus TaxID=34475 RepID=A0ABQ8K8K6_9APHY|nr:peptidase S28 [Rhodofomes roseus]KAH9833657.1 peptidase S28 [Rhodofomes roseus]
MTPLWIASVLACLLASVAGARLPDGRAHANMPPRPIVPVPPAVPEDAVTSRDGTALPPYNTTYYFDQLIDHNDPSKGTFVQRYWHTWEFYEEGGPIILMTPGEVNADGYYGYLTNGTINGQIAQQQNGATIVVEHRFYGYSNPYNNLSVESLQLHTIQQAIDDLVYFAYNVDLPMPGGDSVEPGEAPWVLIGGSYSGALTSWTMVNQPGVFYAGYASSAVVESIVDYWGYFDPIRQYMPANCSADVEAVITYIDETFTNGTTDEINNIKELFNMTELTHLDDFAGALRNNLWDWQSLQPDEGPGQQFFQFCDALEVKDGVSAGSGGWGVDYALNAWGTYWATTYYPLICGDYDPVTCLGTYDPTQSYYTDIEINDSGRSWEWIVCNEVGFFQDGAPEDWPTIVTRLVQPSSDERQCTYYFPEQFPNGPVTPDVNATNSAYAGWFANVTNLFFANGQRDPWREATKSADGTNFESTSWQPIAEGDGYHCSDLLTENALVDETVAEVQEQALASMKEWLAGWEPSSSSRK